MKKFTAVLLLAVMMLTVLVGCSSGGSGQTGKYKLTEMAGFTAADYEELTGEKLGDMMTLELKSGGQFTMNIVGEDSESGTYTINGTTLTLTVDGDDLTGTIEGGKITLEIEGTSVVFEK